VRRFGERIHDGNKVDKSTFRVFKPVRAARAGACGRCPVLSYEENRRLAELERELAVEDPRLARILTEGFVGPAPGAVRRAVLAALAGTVVLILGVASELAVLTLAGYVLVYAAVLRYFFLRDSENGCP
jgi:hypothetical protein